MLKGYRWSWGHPTAVTVLVLCAVALWGPLAAAGAGTVSPTDGTQIYDGFHSVLAYGEGTGSSLQAFSAFESIGTVPSADTSQLQMYEGLEQAWPGFTAADISRYYKNSDFSTEPSASELGTLGSTLSATAEGDQPGTESPESGLTVIRQPPYDVPAIYAQTRPEGMWGVGYVSGEERMFFMDVLRHTAEGTLTELTGTSSASGDSEQLGLQDATAAQLTAQVEALPQEYGAEGAQALSDLENYVTGINAFIARAHQDPALLPAEYTALGVDLEPWTLADSAAVAIYLVGQETVFGGAQPYQSEALDMARARLGATVGTSVYNDLRMVADPGVPTTIAKRFNRESTGRLKPASVANVDPGSVVLRDAETGGPVSSAPARRATARNDAARASLASWAQSLAKDGVGLDREQSNAVLVDAKRSGDGQAVAAMGPQVDYYTPEILFEYELHAPGIDVSGVAFPGSSPYPLIGHGTDFAWTGTSAYTANEDVFAEKLCNPDGSKPSFASRYYVYRGRCIPFVSTVIPETTGVAVTAPSAPTTINMTTLNSVHGPVGEYATVAGAPVALANANATRGHELGSLIAFMRLAEDEVDSPQSFIAAMHFFTGAENWYYVDDRNIAVYQSGIYPRHARGTDADLPIWGTGKYDWKGFDPATNDYDRRAASRNPHSINPPSGYLVNWNNLLAPGWSVAAGEWSDGPGQRATILNDDLQNALRQGPLTLANLTGLVTAPEITTDLRGVVDFPLMARVLGRLPRGTVRTLVSLLANWSQAGSQLRSLTYGGNVEYGPAALLMQTWWPLFVRAEFSPVIGAPLLSLIDLNFEAIGPMSEAGGSGNLFGQGFEMDVDQDLSTLLKVRHSPHFSRVYCGGSRKRAGTVARCRKVLISTLEAAYNIIAAKQGTDPSTWTWGTTCTKTTPASCDQAVSTSAGAISLAPQPLDNRGTFYQAVAITGHRP